MAAAKKAGLDEVDVDVRQGGEREAKWFSFGANAEHGYARNRDALPLSQVLRFELARWTRGKSFDAKTTCRVC